MKKYELNRMCLMKDDYKIQKMNETCMYAPAKRLNNEKGRMDINNKTFKSSEDVLDEKSCTKYKG